MRFDLFLEVLFGPFWGPGGALWGALFGLPPYLLFWGPQGGGRALLCKEGREAVMPEY